MINLVINTNAPAVARNFAKYPQLAKKEYGKALVNSGVLLQREGRRQAPFRTGNLRSSIRRRKLKYYHARVWVDYNKAPYGIYVHEGTVNISPNRFMTRTVQRRQRDVHKEFTKATERIARSLTRGIGSVAVSGVLG